MIQNSRGTVARGVWLQGVLLLGLGLAAAALSAQEGRRAVSKSVPEYPELARRMRLSGKVKLEVTISPSGAVKSAVVIGGNPVLAQAAVEAAKRWKFSPSVSESKQVLEFEFRP